MASRFQRQDGGKEQRSSADTLASVMAPPQTRFQRLGQRLVAKRERQSVTAFTSISANATAAATAAATATGAAAESLAPLGDCIPATSATEEGSGLSAGGSYPRAYGGRTTGRAEGDGVS